MATPDEILESAAEQAASGIKQVQTGDKIIIYQTPKEQIEAAELIAAKNAIRGPFVHVGFRGKVC